ncbi:molybdopterin-dependent oxidoreductase [Halomonas rhizosphaerae]|uniref:Molybdopterin-dependent oxidoreductase n=1 Tax=Halomonas rhizosphaerae TaxID=3043296 RepID=A0ABT6V3S3_9GAMM|nr:molybdopterin-dependent oxidoreductase [Halomonas rhizosphaerae]MDI5892860.1 molybdopterin-dependent oxidoreductase [Halomonas rhizosphaerae]
MLTGIPLRPLVLLLLALVPFSIALASPLPTPKGTVLLTLSGDIANANVGDEAHFDRAMLQALPTRVIETHTPWHRDRGRYEGPLVRALLEAVGADDVEQVRIRALNHYEAEVPVSDFRRHDVILAMTRDGESLTIREYGPLFVLYPFDEHPELLTEAIRFRSVWHVEQIIVP